jgi:phospholipid/cholesterol/gamma-HCH transport system substrate-binding protein
VETRANYFIIGLFTLAVVFGVFGFVYWFQNIGGHAERAYYSAVFDGSVSGLRTGATVLFNGIRVGEVTDLKLDPQRPKQVVAIVAIDKSVAVRKDTEVGLEFQGLTGIASVALKGGSPASPALAGDKANPPLLTAAPGAAQDVTQGARDTLRRLDSFIDENKEAFHSALSNLDTFSQSLARNSERIDKITQGLQSLAAGEDGKGGELFEAVHSIRTLSDHLDERTAEITKGITTFTAAGTKQINAIGADAHRMMAEAEKTVKNINQNPSRLLFGGAPAAK